MSTYKFGKHQKKCLERHVYPRLVATKPPPYPLPIQPCTCSPLTLNLNPPMKDSTLIKYTLEISTVKHIAYKHGGVVFQNDRSILEQYTEQTCILNLGHNPRTLWVRSSVLDWNVNRVSVLKKKDPDLDLKSHPHPHAWTLGSNPYVVPML